MEKIKVVLDPAPIAGYELILNPDLNMHTGIAEFNNEFGSPTTLEQDLLLLSSAIFASDLAIKRGDREHVTRNIELTIPVVNLAVFNNISKKLSYALHVLSHDAWIFNFVQREGQPEGVINWGEQKTGKVLLFSGGLDSFSAAIKYADAGDKIQLVSHITANPIVSGTQKSLYQYLVEQYPDQFGRISFRISGKDCSSQGFPFPVDREESQRTRSFMFLSLAGLVARRLGYRDIVLIAENGPMAVHLPLSAGRISAFSTHTAHPEFISLMSEILSTALNYGIRIDNPFLYMTKAEVARLVLPRHLNVIKNTVSCWKASRVLHDYRHCGICIPCLIRRLALESNSVYLNEYKVDLLRMKVSSLSPDDDGKRNLVDLCEFITFFKGDITIGELQTIYPELINPNFNLQRVVDMYKRFAQEANNVFQNYPEVRALWE
jgi:7-cyano-7-deazaguanine synthase in queuosine biosynthesis